MYTVLERDLSGSGITKVPENGKDPSAHDMLKNLSLSADLNTAKVSSTYLFHALGGWSAGFIDWILKSCMFRLATMELMDDPMAALCSCSDNLSWKWKYVSSRQDSSRLMEWSTVINAMCWSSPSCYSFLLMTIMTGSTGTNLKAALTS